MPDVAEQGSNDQVDYIHPGIFRSISFFEGLQKRHGNIAEALQESRACVVAECGFECRLNAGRNAGLNACLKAG